MLYEKSIKDKERGMIIVQKLRLKRHGSFYVREGWMEKAINIIAEKKSEGSIFRKEAGVANLGIGAMMVTSLKYWMVASEIINEKTSELTDFGNLLLKHDPYLEYDFSWWMIHQHLVCNFKDSPIFNIAFNNFRKGTFTKEELIDFISEYIKESDYECGNEKYISDDVSILINTYLKGKIENPEDNKISPFAKLELLKHSDDNKYEFSMPRRDKLSFLVVYDSLIKSMNGKESINIDDLAECKNNPIKIYNLDKNSFYLYLNDMKEDGLITINKTAGLNMIYINEDCSIEGIDAIVFEKYFKEGTK